MSNLHTIFKELSANQQGNIFYYPNGGNAGDALIDMGFYTLAQRFNLKFSLISQDKISQLKDNDIVLIGGGGCLVPEWNSTPNFLKSLINLKLKLKLIILPHSIRGIDDLISNLPEGSIIFCREKYSFEYCQNISNAKAVYLADDMAFCINPAQILTSNPHFKIKLSSKNIIRKILINFHRLRALFTSQINAMRTDKESNQNLNVKRSLANDLSLVASFGTDNYQASLYSAKQFLKLINLYEEIKTDRLHVAVGAYLLNKKLSIYNNGYYKCKGVYEQSMSYSNNVTFIE
ncbi:polysaccharide pyruvyl transferase family protein [Actinobacillus equuli subsp. haemolyticus]|uniref:polysaccharide pyruvyl transferase family protein n=1 Tax=Actinobacillus equuli TaxID=718 RepID=UPI00244201F8|nr:polysaccharide pyruvyl transferase family protein [Actinobacillus equuli]WGE50846.1 polysaccharide pyruvyl transferase family protein [Actinobacillus equuli subsp. haemolyticus]WGE63280.1 polysaccharide pyruvyl transferase family protein [Actinobacillus equuli subsp. haemolyticus]WGE69427.1 polysaccharide pyruvyl transferase family protein [Actinobacillus equuli subsp. haemolyticus]WGE81444.1 polysaccharide pyruvyl transferase family protein [Actinobacillus equuli subsp. haemolyticus]